MAGKIFINYRRGDDAGFTQALYMRLEDEFDRHDLFMDVEGHIKPGDDFTEVLNAQVGACDVLLVVIGPRWEELLAARAGARDDFVAIEIQAALDTGKRVIPVLVGGAAMPRAESMPETIRPLAHRNAVGLRPERFKADCQGLIAALKEQLANAEAERAARTDAERAAAEGERQRRSAEDAARLAAAEDRARAQSVEGLSSEQILKAEELANWDFIQDRGDAQALRDHMARFPGGVTVLYANAKLEEIRWASIGPVPDLVALRAFLDEFPKGQHAEKVRAEISKLEKAAVEAEAAERRKASETGAWAAASASDSLEAYQAFLAEWPASEHAKAAQTRMRELKREPFQMQLYLGIGLAGGALVAAGIVGVLPVADLVDAIRPLPAFKEPEMVTIAAGSFMMGSNENDHEKPIHKVSIAKPFEVGKYAVTFDEWDICVKDGGCKISPSSQHWGRGRRPVINVSWTEATDEYLPWLSKKTGKTYRLMTEAEWEYAARAGTTTKYYWGDDIEKNNANCDGCGSEWDNKKTAPVGSFSPNAFGLYDMSGNVWQWIQDCYSDNYGSAPLNGSIPNTAKDCSSRIIRGGSWFNSPRYLRSADRNWDSSGNRYYVLGFRVARTLFTP